MKKLLLTYTLCTSILISACATTTPTKREITSAFENNKDSSYLLNSAMAAMQNWEKSSRYADLLSAKKYYRAGLELRPDDLNFQRGNYIASYPLAAAGTISEETILALYEALHPMLKATVSSPYRIGYLQARRDKLYGRPMIDIIIKGLQKNTHDEYLWSGLATELTGLNYPIQAAAYFREASKRAPEKAYYVVGSGEALMSAYWNQDCPRDGPELGRKALKYFLAANKLEANDSYVTDIIGSTYSILGLPPLALKYSKKAYELAPDEWTTYNYGYTAFYSGQYDIVKRLADELIQTKNSRNGLDLSILASFVEGDTKKAAALAQQVITTYDTDGAEQLVWHWLINTTTKGSNFADIASIPADESVSQRILDYIKSSDDSPLLTSKNDSTCDQSLAHFVTAIKALHRNDTLSAKSHFKQVVAMRHYGYAEYDFSLAILNNWTNKN